VPLYDLRFSPADLPAPCKQGPLPDMPLLNLRFETLNEYDGLNRLVKTTDAEGIEVTFAYHQVGNRTGVTDGRRSSPQPRGTPTTRSATGPGSPTEGSRPLSLSTTD
jgi:YD repeat-containing protein